MEIYRPATPGYVLCHTCCGRSQAGTPDMRTSPERKSKRVAEYSIQDSDNAEPSQPGQSWLIVANHANVDQSFIPAGPGNGGPAKRPRGARDEEPPTASEGSGTKRRSVSPTPSGRTPPVATKLKTPTRAVAESKQDVDQPDGGQRSSEPVHGRSDLPNSQPRESGHLQMVAILTGQIAGKC